MNKIEPCAIYDPSGVGDNRGVAGGSPRLSLSHPEWQAGVLQLQTQELT